MQTLDDAYLLSVMRARQDPGPCIFYCDSAYRIAIMDSLLPCEQTSAGALATLLKAYYVYRLQLPQFRTAMLTLISLCFGIARKSSNCFKEVVNCVMSTNPNA